MESVHKIFQFGYLIIAIVFIVEAVLGWSEDRMRSYMYLAFAVVAVFMFFFKKRFREKIRNKDK